jgi:hypothetical protein
MLLPSAPRTPGCCLRRRGLRAAAFDAEDSVLLPTTTVVSATNDRRGLNGIVCLRVKSTNQCLLSLDAKRVDRQSTPGPIPEIYHIG